MDKQISKEELRSRRRRSIIKTAVIAVAILAAVGALLQFDGGRSVSESDLKLGSVTLGPLESSVAASGRLVPAFEEIVNSPVGSRIMEVYARPGDSVRAGEALLRLDLQDADAQYQNLRAANDIKSAQLRQLQLSNHSALSDLEMQTQIKEMEVNRLAVEVENERRLDSLGSGTGDRVRQAETAYATGKLELAGLRKRLVNERERLNSLEESARLELGNSTRDVQLMERTLAQGRIPAPHDGVLTFLKTQIGSTVSTGEKLAVVSDLSAFKVEAEVPEGSSYKVTPGSSAILRLGNIELEGSVENVEPQSTSGGVPFTVQLYDASNPRLRAGLRVQVYVAYGFKEQVLRIPQGNYFKGPGDYVLFVDDGSRTVRQRKVILGDSNREWVEVVDGLKTGERVATIDMTSYEKYKKLTLRK
ncbi:MAG: HlyD family efflux transporter periplasmic adaptor subunit [Muribaculaceae bacterium]|nr:HlyD family efflux transporter periplasmic adaptor subunit [Muribaculaceae bacterium]